MVAMSIFSLVAVRKGSKGLEDKCIRKVAGKPVFEYTIEYSIDLASKIEEEVATVVSSDSEVIREYCSEREICFVERSPLLASDIAQIEDVIYDAYCKTGRDFDFISLLYGNIPTRYPEEFLKAYNFLVEHEDYDCVLSMQKVGKFNPAWMFELDEDILPAKKSGAYRRQDLKEFMIHDGHTILFRTKRFLAFMGRNAKETVMYQAFGKKTKPMLSSEVVIDIDTGKDLELAEAVLRCGNTNMER
jgi:CMP-N-acetylneuraminic acid synthetase